MKPLILTVVCALLVSCTSQISSPENSLPAMLLAGSEWGGNIEGQYMHFEQGGILKGNGGCNQFSANYTQNGSQISIGIIEQTEMGCDVLEDEIVFFTTLQAATSIDAKHLILVLKDKNGKPLMRFKRRDWD